jgi:rhodanese-related sulfurtransferase
LSPAQIRQALGDGVRVVDIGDRVALIAYPGEEQAAALRLARVGSDNAIGYLNVDRGGRFPVELSDLVQTAPRVTPAELDRLLAEDGVILVDIRNPGEVELGRIPGSVRIPLAQLRNRLDVLPSDRPIVVHCAGGWRSSVAASLLRTHGFDNVADLDGGHNAWVDAHVSSNALQDTLFGKEHENDNSPCQFRFDDRWQPDHGVRCRASVSPLKKDLWSYPRWRQRPIPEQSTKTMVFVTWSLRVWADHVDVDGRQL